MSTVEGQKSGGGTAVLPLNATGTAVACEIENVTLTVDTTGLATSTKQSDGTQKTQQVDASGNVAPAGDTVARASFVKVTNGTQTMPTGDVATRPVFVEITDGTTAVTVATAAKQDTGNTSLATIATNTTSVATSTKQSDGSQKTQIVDSAGTHTMPAGDAATRPVFVELTDGSAAVGTSGNPVRVNPTAVVASASTDTGQNLSLADTASHAFGTSAVATIGVLVSAPAENTATVYVALGSGVTSGATGKGYPLVPGAGIFLPGVLNSNLVYAITGTATQNVHALAI